LSQQTEYKTVFNLSLKEVKWNEIQIHLYDRVRLKGTVHLKNLIMP